METKEYVKVISGKILTETREYVKVISGKILIGDDGFLCQSHKW
jgi:hypothetical protein